jgi:hypothetical protein
MDSGGRSDHRSFGLLDVLPSTRGPPIKNAAQMPAAAHII